MEIIFQHKNYKLTQHKNSICYEFSTKSNVTYIVNPEELVKAYDVGQVINLTDKEMWEIMKFKAIISNNQLSN